MKMYLAAIITSVIAPVKLFYLRQACIVSEINLRDRLEDYRVARSKFLLLQARVVRIEGDVRDARLTLRFGVPDDIEGA
jgi:hypothetical protein